MNLEELEKQRKQWEEKTLGKVLSKFPERSPKFLTDSGIEFHRVYFPTDVRDLDYQKDLGFPGEYPYTRGIQPTMYRGRLWTMRQYAGFANARESNRRYRFLLDHGQTGLSIAFDLPTQIGYDSDHPLADGEVGKVGVAIDSLRDMEVLFDQIPQEKVTTSMTINATAAILLAMYVALARKRSTPLDKLGGTIQNDILKEYVARGTHRFPITPSMRLVTDIFKYCTKNLPRWNMISISGYHIREAGSTAVQEVAFTLANAIAYVQAAVESGLDIDAFAGRLSFFFNSHNNFFEEVAKFRAARRLWARIMKERFGSKKPDSDKLRFHTQTAGCTLTVQQHENNVIRVAMQALAAVLGGTQSLHTNSRDEALCLPTEEAVRLALRTQQLIAYETGVADSVDPLGGSYLVEKLTDEIEEAAEEYIKKIDSMGGAIAAIKSGFMQKEIQDSSYRYQQGIESGEKVIVGVNKFQTEEAPPDKLLEVDLAVQAEQIESLKKVRAERDAAAVGRSLKALHEAAAGDANLMESIIECVENYVTLGEICSTLAEIFGEATETNS
ncbi:MAG: methylmalonyl-CoA mutase [Candidatus Abyssobacteria bacterium SURF_17]|uniref:Methylmalonyl-CoA mutase n=1 Tax=Candidatus Abyssobacteria bacterium SURF_17 TaxID=2093361 RepID=A0A419EUK7_9BACT|nr:MAG: methylmalonyl-CoA mutase [Candidatus Abyssubacteria bacterium SURF_17]